MTRIEVWTVDLDRIEPARPGTLSSQEEARAAGFRAEHDRRRWTASAGALRSILSSYLDIQPADLELTAGPQGRPELVGEPVRFNLSHSHGLMVCAVAPDRSVGIDCERVDGNVDIETVLERFLPATDDLARLPAGERRVAMFRRWVRLEAYLKARGVGMYATPDAFAGPLEAGHLPGPVPVQEATPTGAWQVSDLEVPGGYVGAVVAPGSDWEPVYRTWPPGRG